MNPKSVSQKVWAQVIVTLVLGSLVAALGAVTPGMLVALGPWAPVVFAGITALGAGIAGYVVTDPVRAAGASTLAIHASIAAAAPVGLPDPAPEPVQPAVLEDSPPPMVVDEPHAP